MCHSESNWMLVTPILLCIWFLFQLVVPPLCAATILVLSHLANTFGCIFVAFHTMARPSYDVFFCVTFFSNKVQYYLIYTSIACNLCLIDDGNHTLLDPTYYETLVTYSHHTRYYLLTEEWIPQVFGIYVLLRSTPLYT